MSRIFSIFLALSTAASFTTIAANARLQLQGNSQYGGLLRNVNSGKCIDVFGASTNKNANIQQYACNGGGNQRWEFINIGNGQFAIRNLNSGLVMDVAGDNRGNGANVQQFPWNSGANQRWFARGPNNNFELVNVNSGKCLDVQGGGMGNNVNIIQFQCNGGRNQRWFAGYSMPGGGAPGPGPGYPGNPGILPPGMGGGPSGARQFTGMIMNVGSRKCTDVYGDSRRPGANVQQYGCNGGANQKWVFISVGRNEYVIQNVNSGMVLEVPGGSRGNGGNVQQFSWNGGANQRWRGRGPNNNFELVNVNSGKCMAVQGGGSANNTNIIQFDCNGGSNQRWFIGYTQ
jgi:Ricin-type beta-trefoil lectin domain